MAPGSVLLSVLDSTNKHAWFAQTAPHCVKCLPALRHCMQNLTEPPGNPDACVQNLQQPYCCCTIQNCKRPSSTPAL